MRTRGGGKTRVKRSRGRPRKVVNKLILDESSSEYPAPGPDNTTELTNPTEKGSTQRGTSGGGSGSAFRGSLGRSSECEAEKLSMINDVGNESTICMNKINSKKDYVDNWTNEQFMFTLENEGEENHTDDNDNVKDVDHINEENNVSTVTLLQFSKIKENCDTLTTDMVFDLTTESVTSVGVPIDSGVPGNGHDCEDKENNNQENYLSTAGLDNSSQTKETPSTIGGFTLTMDTPSDLPTLSANTIDVPIVVAPTNEDVEEDNNLKQLAIEALNKSKEADSGSEYCPGSDSESGDDIDLPFNKTTNTTKVILETSGSFIQTRPGSSGDIGKKKVVRTPIRTPNTRKSYLDSLNLAISSESESDGLDYNNQLIDDNRDEDDQQSKSPDNVGLDSTNTDQQKVGEQFEMSTRGCGRIFPRHVLRGQTRGGNRSLRGFRGRISKGGVNRGRIQMERGRGRFSRSGIGGGFRGISPLPRVSRNMTSMRPDLGRQSLNQRNPKYASYVNTGRSQQREMFQSESSTFETRIDEIEPMMEDFERRVVVKQEEPEMIDLTEEPTITRLQSYGISVSRVIEKEKEVRLPDCIKLPPSITVTQTTPRPGCSSWQSPRYY